MHPEVGGYIAWRIDEHGNGLRVSGSLSRAVVAKLAGLDYRTDCSGRGNDRFTPFLLFEL
jgi:hypothetical protein